VKSYRDLWLWLGAAFLTASAGLLASALAYFTKIQKYSLFSSWWMLAAILVFLAAFACFYSAIKGVAFPPWEELRFPQIKVEFYGSSNVMIPRTGMDGLPVDPFYIWFYRIHIVNLEKEQNASLIIRPLFSLAPDSQGPFAEAAGSHVKIEQLAMFLNPTYNNSFASNPLPETIRLSPGGSETGDLVYMIATFEWQKLAEPGQVRLVIEDLISGKKMEKRFDGNTWPKFTTKDMSPAELGIRMLQQNQDNGAHNSPARDATATITEVKESCSSQVQQPNRPPAL
jgi:hypothetical protein